MIKVSLVFIMFCEIVYAQNVEIHGRLMAMMHGDLSAHYSLEQLQHTSNIYGLGALADLKGEIMVIDSKPYVSKVQQGHVSVDTSYNYSAALFAFSKVQNWKTDVITSAHSIGLDGLEKILAAKAGQEPEPLTFLIEGQVQTLKWHVINWPEGDTVHTYQKHKASGLSGTLQDEPLIIFGFYSTQHRGVLTHLRSNLHLHFITKNKSLAGHVDGLVLKKGVIRIADND